MDHEIEAYWSALMQPVSLPRIARRPSWHSRAACRGVGVDLFFQSPGATDQSWRSFCGRCEVSAECLASAMADPACEGNWASTTKRDRNRLRRSSRAA